MAMTAFQRSFLEAEPADTVTRAAEFERAGLSKPLSAGGAPGRTARDVRTLAGMGIETPVLEAGFPLIPAVVAAGAAVAPHIPKIAAWGTAAWAALQALGLGEGEGLFGVDIFGGNGRQPQQLGGGVPFEGPGLREPSAQYVVKEWKRRIDSREGDYNLQFYLVKMPGHAYRIYMYSQRTGGWKSWGLPRPAVIGKNMPSHKMLTRLRRNLRKHAADAKTILMVASPTAYAKQLGYKRAKMHRH